MNITWFNENNKNIYVTLTSKHITINKVGVPTFEKAYKVMLGYSKHEEKIIIKPLTKKEAIRGDIKEDTMYNVSIGATYARITNKSFLKRIDNLFNLKQSDSGVKYKGFWRNDLNVLEILLKDGA